MRDGCFWQISKVFVFSCFYGLLDFLKNVCGDDKTAPKWNTFKLAYILLSDICDWKNIYLS